MTSRAVANADFQIDEVGGAAVGEFVMLQMAPDVFWGIELGRVGRQLLDLYGTVQSLQVFAHQL